VTFDLFDTHAHLHFPEFAADLGTVLERARASGVRRMLTIGLPGSWMFSAIRSLTPLTK